MCVLHVAYGGLDTEWSPWSNCTDCGHTQVKRRAKTCLSPVSKTSGAHCPLIQQIAPCNNPCPGWCLMPYSPAMSTLQTLTCPHISCGTSWGQVTSGQLILFCDHFVLHWHYKRTVVSSGLTALEGKRIIVTTFKRNITITR